MSPRLTLTGLLFCFGAMLMLAVAAPLPKLTPAPTPKGGSDISIGILTLEDNTIVFKRDFLPSRVTMVQKVETELVDGKETVVTKPVVETTYTQDTIKQIIDFRSNRVTTTKGEVIAEEDLRKLLTAEITAVMIPSNADPEWRKFFTDDVLFIEIAGVPLRRIVWGAGEGGFAPPQPMVPMGLK